MRACLHPDDLPIEIVVVVYERAAAVTGTRGDAFVLGGLRWHDSSSIAVASHVRSHEGDHPLDSLTEVKHNGGVARRSHRKRGAPALADGQDSDSRTAAPGESAWEDKVEINPCAAPATRRGTWIERPSPAEPAVSTTPRRIPPCRAVRARKLLEPEMVLLIRLMAPLGPPVGPCPARSVDCLRLQDAEPNPHSSRFAQKPDPVSKVCHMSVISVSFLLSSQDGFRRFPAAEETGTSNYRRTRRGGNSG